MSTAQVEERLALEELYLAAVAYHEDCGHGQAGSVAECDPVCDAMLKVREIRQLAGAQPPVIK